MIRSILYLFSLQFIFGLSAIANSNCNDFLIKVILSGSETQIDVNATVQSLAEDPRVPGNLAATLKNLPSLKASYIKNMGELVSTGAEVTLAANPQLSYFRIDYEAGTIFRFLANFGSSRDSGFSAIDFYFPTAVDHAIPDEKWGQIITMMKNQSSPEPSPFNFKLPLSPDELKRLNARLYSNSKTDLPPSLTESRSAAQARVDQQSNPPFDEGSFYTTQVDGKTLRERPIRELGVLRSLRLKSNADETIIDPDNNQFDAALDRSGDARFDYEGLSGRYTDNKGWRDDRWNTPNPHQRRFRPNHHLLD